MGANVLVEFENIFFNWGLFFKLGAMGEKLLVEFENVFLIGGIFYNWGNFFLSWGQKIILGSRKSIIWTPALMFLAGFKISKIKWVSFCWKNSRQCWGSKLVYISAFFRFGLGC